MLQKKI